MPLGAQILIALVIVLAAWIVTHVALLVRTLGVSEITSPQRWMAWLPVTTPYVGWKLGKKRHAVLWGLLMVLYLALRVSLALR